MSRSRAPAFAPPHAPTLALTLALALVGPGCEGLTPSGGGPDAGPSAPPSAPPRGDEPSDTYQPPPGPVALLRIANLVMPSHLALDVCFSNASASPPVFAIGPIFRGTHDAAHFGAVTMYRRVPPGRYRARFVVRDSPDCEATVVGLPDLPLEVALVEGRRATLALAGDVTLAPPSVTVRVLEDEVTVPEGRVALRVAHFATRVGAVDFGPYESYGSSGREEPDRASFAPLIEGLMPLAVSPGDANGYFFVPREPNRFFTTFGFRLRGAAEDFFGSQRSSDQRINSGAWTFFLRNDDRAVANGTMCRDGGRADEPRLCYPCGAPDCEGR